MEYNLQEQLQQYLELFFKDYTEIVGEKYHEEYSTHKDSFLFMNPFTMYFIQKDSFNYCVFSYSEEIKVSFVDCTNETVEDLEILNTALFKQRETFMYDKLKLPISFSDMPLHNFIKNGLLIFNEHNFERLPEHVYRNADSFARQHAETYYLTKTLDSILKPSLQLENIDFTTIIENVKDPSFQYEFEESVKAYNTGIYLAAAAAGGIALENILRQLIKRELGPQYLPDKTYIWKSVDVLTKNEILSGRLRGRINQQSEIRNTNSHTNDDPVTKETVDNLYGVIRDISNLFS